MKKSKQRKAAYYNRMRCPYCGSPVIFRSSEGIIKGNPKKVKLYVCLRYPACNAYVRVHEGTRIPVGELATPELRSLRRQAHLYFDQLYLSGLMSKQVAYQWLSDVTCTGLRLGEAMGLTWDCVDFEKGALNINKQLQRRPQKDGGSTLTSVKSGKPRILRPAPFVMDLLKVRYTEQLMQKSRAGEAWIGWNNEEEHKKSLVFTNLDGGYITPKRVYLHFKSAANEIGAPNARVHDLRHTYAVLSLKNGDDVKTVQENLGHASAAFTLDVYGHVSDKMKRDSAARMEEYIKRLNASGT